MNNSKICFVGNYKDGYGFYSTVIKVGKEFKKIDDTILQRMLKQRGVSVIDFIKFQQECRMAISSNSGESKMWRAMGEPFWDFANDELLKIAGIA